MFYVCSTKGKTNFHFAVQPSVVQGQMNFLALEGNLYLFPTCLPVCVSFCRLCGWSCNHSLTVVPHPSEGERADWIRALQHLWLPWQQLVCVQICQQVVLKWYFSPVQRFHLSSNTWWDCTGTVNMWDLLVHDIWFQCCCVLIQFLFKTGKKTLVKKNGL